MKQNIIIKEALFFLKATLEQEKLPNRRIRLEALIMKKEDVERSNIEIAEMLNISRQTVGIWFNAYKKEGLRTYLDLERSGSRARKLLSDEQQRELKKMIKKKKVSTYRQAQKWLNERFGILMEYKNVHAFIKYQMKLVLESERTKKRIITPFQALPSQI